MFLFLALIQREDDAKRARLDQQSDITVGSITISVQ